MPSDQLLLTILPEASVEEVAAAVAALEEFVRDTAPTMFLAVPPTRSVWKRAALAEAISSFPDVATDSPRVR